MAKIELTIFVLSSLFMALITTVNGQITDATSDPAVEEVGKFAVDEYSKGQPAKLTFSKVVQATKETDAAGTKYDLKIDASDSGEMKTFNSEVVVKTMGDKEMLSFSPAKH